MKKFLYTLIFTTTVLFSETQSDEYRQKNYAREILESWIEVDSEINVLLHDMDCDEEYLFYLEGKLEAYEECINILSPDVFRDLDFIRYLSIL